MEKQSTRKFLKLIVALVALFLLGASALMLASCKDEHVHSYDAGVVTTQPTCSTDGVKTFTCSGCGETRSEPVPATNDHAWEKIKVYANSCESEGWTVYECSVCGDQKQGDWTPKLDHQYEAVETVEETCTTDGYQIMQCSYCGDRYTDDQYSSEHKATGHKWIVNTDAEDPASDEDKKNGFVTVKEADCLNAAQLQRTCSVCGHTEDKEGAPALGHLWNDEVVTSKTANLCKVNPSLIDAEGNAVYAYECEREDCPVEVVIDSADHTRHYIKAEEHKLKVVHEDTFCLDEDATVNETQISLPNGTNAQGAGKRYEICENCNTYGDKYDETENSVNKVTDLEPTGHNWNTIQLDGKTPVVVCEADAKLTSAAYLDAMKKALGTTAYAPLSGAFTQAYGNATKGGKGVSRYCSDCGALQIAGGHDYVIAALEEGKYDLNDYEKDENGLPVEAEGVTVATMDCRYVQVCKNEGCGKVLERGAHGEVTTATCRKGGFCELCGEQFTAQLKHNYINIASLVDESGKVKDGDIATGITYKAAYDAYVKVSATETWMKPVTGNCEDQKTNVYVCLNCLMTAADEKSEEEVVWNQATELPATAEDGPEAAVSSTNAYVIDAGLGHDYQPTYYRLSDKTEIPYSQTTCAVGFLVKYTCDVCGDVYMNVPVANDPKTVDEDSEKETTETNEAAVNDPGKLGFTDADGFIINTPADPENKITDFYKNEEFQAEELAAALASLNNHQRVHSIQVATEYADRNGYVASTCVSTAIIPVVCENCGATLAYTWADFVEADKNDANGEEHPTLGFALNRDDPATEGEDTSYSFGEKVADADKKLNYLNHAGKAFDCGTHCDVKNAAGTQYLCSGFVGNHSTTWDKNVSEVSNEMTAAYHATVTVDYKLASDSQYYADYSLKVATFFEYEEGKVIDWTKATMTDNTKLSLCSAADGEMPAYTMPQAAVPGDNGSYTHPESIADSPASIYYFVLVSADGKNIYPVTEGLKLYTESDSDSTSVVASTTKVEQDDTFFLSLSAVTNLKAPVFATDVDSLAKAVKVADPVNGVLTITLAKDTTFETIGSLSGDTAQAMQELLNAIKGKFSEATGETLVLDLNGSTIPLAADPIIDNKFANIDAITVKNGTINYTGTGSYTTAADPFLTIGSTEAKSEYAAVVTFDNVDINAGALNGISVATNSKLVMKDSSVTSYGAMGISVDAPTETTVPETLATVIDMTNTNIVMTKALPTDTAAMSTAMLVGAPVNVSVKGGEFSATMQALVVRGGNVSVSTTKLTVNAYTDTRVVWNDAADSGVTKPEFTDGRSALGFSELGGDTTGALAGTDWVGFVDGITDVQTYRLAGVWGEGAAVARAAVVLGNSDTGAYEFEATLRLDRVSWSVAEGAEKVVVGTSYASSVFTDNTKTEGEGANQKTTYTPVVTLNATGSNLNVAEVVYTFISYDGATLKNANYISMVGLIPAAN